MFVPFPVVLLASLAVVEAAVEFTNPVSSNDFPSTEVFTYRLGSLFTIAWTKFDQPARLSMGSFVDDQSEAVAELITSDLVNVTSFRWRIETTMEKPEERTYYFWLQNQEDEETAAFSRSFHLSDTGSAATPSVETVTITPNSATSSTISNLAPSSSPPSNTSPSNTAPLSITSALSTPSNVPAKGVVSNSSTGLKVGLGVGIQLAAIIGAAIGWFLFRRKRAETHPNAPAVAHLEQGHQGGVYQPTTTEKNAPDYMPVEMPAQAYGK